MEKPKWIFWPTQSLGKAELGLNLESALETSLHLSCPNTVLERKWVVPIGSIPFSIFTSLLFICYWSIALPRRLSGKDSACQCRKCGFDLWIGKIPWKRERQPTPVFLSGESHGRRSLVGCSLRGHKESDTTQQRNNNITDSARLNSNVQQTV